MIYHEDTKDTKNTKPPHTPHYLLSLSFVSFVCFVFTGAAQSPPDKTKPDYTLEIPEK